MFLIINIDGFRDSWFSLIRWFLDMLWSMSNFISCWMSANISSRR